MKKAVFLDRDGVINQKAPEGDYITRWEDFRFLPGTSEGIAVLNRADYKVFVVSNQRCVSKGLISKPDLELLHGRMLAQLASEGAAVDGIYYCPHDYADSCSCRKPQPGMLLQAARENDIDLHVSWMVGDTRSDLEAGRSAGCLTAYITDGAKSGIDADLVAGSLLDTAKLIVKRHV